MTTSIQGAVQHMRRNPPRRRRLPFLAGVLTVLTGASTAWAINVTIAHTDKRLEVKSTFNATKLGCVLHRHALALYRDGHSGSVALFLFARDASCEQAAGGDSFSGRSYVGLVKQSSDTFTFCTRDLADTGGWRQGEYSWSQQYQNPPCGPGFYKVISCSESLVYRKATPSGPVIGTTIDDCSSFWNWSISPNWMQWL